MQQPQKPKEGWARVYTDKSKDSLDAIKLLRNSGYRVINFPVSQGTMGPELELGRSTYRGLKEIKRLIEE